MVGSFVRMKVIRCRGERRDRGGGGEFKFVVVEPKNSSRIEGYRVPNAK